MKRMRWLAAGVLLLLSATLASCALFVRPPVAAFDVTPVIVYAGETIELDADASYGNAPLVSYSWEI
jgi:hypothetical protein